MRSASLISVTTLPRGFRKWMSTYVVSYVVVHLLVYFTTSFRLKCIMHWRFVVMIWKKHYCIFATLFSNARALALLTASHLFLRFCLVSCCFLLSVFVSSKNIALYESFRNPPLISSPWQSNFFRDFLLINKSKITNNNWLKLKEWRRMGRGGIHFNSI